MNYATKEILKAKNDSDNPLFFARGVDNSFVIFDLKNTFKETIPIVKSMLDATDWEDWGSAKIKVDDTEYEVDYNIYSEEGKIHLSIYPLKESEKLNIYETDTSFQISVVLQQSNSKHIKGVHDKSYH